MSNTGRVGELIDRIRALERQGHALKAPFGGGPSQLAVDNALMALALVEAAVREGADDDVLTGLEDTVEHIGHRLAHLARSSADS